MTDNWKPQPQLFPGTDIGFSSYAMPDSVAPIPEVDESDKPRLHWIPAYDDPITLEPAKPRFLSPAWWKALRPARLKAKQPTFRDTSTSARNADGGTTETGPEQ